MKRKFIMVVAVMGLLVAGCGMSSEQRIALYKQAIDKAVATSQTLDSFIPAIDAAIAESEKAIAAGLPEADAAKLLDKIAEAKAVKAKVLEEKAKIDQAAKEAQAKIDAILAGGESDIEAELNSIAAILTSAGAVIPPPTGPFVSLAGVILGIIGGVIGGKKSQAKYKTGLVEVIKSVNAVISKAPSEEYAGKIKEVLKTVQSDTTRTLVDSIKAVKAA